MLFLPWNIFPQEHGKTESESVSHSVASYSETSWSPPGSSVHGKFQARIQEWVAIPFPRDLSDPGIKSMFPALQADSLPSEPWKSRNS